MTSQLKGNCKDMCIIYPVKTFVNWIIALFWTCFKPNQKGYCHQVDEDIMIGNPEGKRTCVLKLHKDQHLETELFRVRKGYEVEIKAGPSLFGHTVKFYSDIPINGQVYSRGKYSHIQTATIIVDQPGSFHFYFTLDNNVEKRGSGYILVEPDLQINDENVPLDCIQCITVLSKCLGPLPTWADKLAVAKHSGYNMIHFTPVQELGGSNSAYCLKDQLKLNPVFSDNGPPSLNQLEEVISKIRTDWKVLSICDIVLNHTANESLWLLEHPECAYNLKNSPHLRPAYVLDALLHKLSKDIAKGDYELSGIPSALNSEDHIGALRYVLSDRLIPQAKLWEMYSVDTAKYVSEFRERAFSVTAYAPNHANQEGVVIIQDPAYGRLTSTINLDLALEVYNVYRTDCFDEDTRLRKCTESFKRRLDELNDQVRERIQSHLNAAVDNVIASVRYFRIQGDGPKHPIVNDKYPLVERYFIENGPESSESAAYSENGKFIMAHNGWVMDYDPLNNFAAPTSDVYLRRELIPWGDSVKLRYGDSKDDCPYLWERMKNYVTTTVKVFDGVRLDNCHSTPIHVAQYLLDAAREIRPNTYVVAELFSNSDSTDNVFVNKLGISSLIREAMSGWDSHEVGRLVYRFGGRVVGAMSDALPRVPHALFIDMTHDNKCPLLTKSPFDLLPTAALVSMAACASGSTMGYDQLVPHHIHVVDENREYPGLSEISPSSGIMLGKAALNKLHYNLSKLGFDQVFVDQIDQDIVCVTRHNEKTLESVVLFAYTAFQWPSECKNGEGKGVSVSGMAHSVILEAKLCHKTGAMFTKYSDHVKDSKVINGLDDYILEIKEGIPLEKSTMVQSVPCGNMTRLNLTRLFQPGSVLVIRVVARASSKEAAEKLSCPIDFTECLSHLSLSDLNYILYRCPSEDGVGPYNIPGFGNLVYCGIQGVMSILEEVAENEDLGHPLCANLRNGPWLGEYLTGRLVNILSTLKLGNLLQEKMQLIEELPVSLKPAYFYKVISQAHKALLKKAYSLMSLYVQEGNDLVRLISHGSLQCCGTIKSASLPKLINSTDEVPTLAAGLPHFASGYMRCWGRDTFISLRGLLLLTGRYSDARNHILGFGSCLRHGLIPNLLDCGVKPRYNCRDAVWWWLYSIKSYCELAPQGSDILQDTLYRIFPTDDSPPTQEKQKLHEVIQEALSVHFQGLTFRERNAGKEIDEHMLEHGFDNQIGVHPNTGFIFGGSELNCGTWMDKMGSSEKAGNRGKPATPRDGSAVELTALAYTSIKWISQLHKLGKYPERGVTRTHSNGKSTTWLWDEWCEKIKNNFEKEFWIGEKGPLVNRMHIYKDSVGATQAWADYQLRPNFFVALVVAPDLFSVEKAQLALETSKVLEGPLGMKTLDPSDWAYSPYYNNSDDSNDQKVAHGFNYHQGPEWLWLTGFYLRALLKFSPHQVCVVKEKLSAMWSAIERSQWRGLPELTNKDGEPCLGSCPTQAWSMATIMEVLDDLKNLGL